MKIEGVSETKACRWLEKEALRRKSAGDRFSMHDHLTFSTMAVDTCNQHVCSLLACSSEDLAAFDEKDTDALSDELLTTILPQAEVHDALVAASSRYRLDRLLQGMLIHAPHPSGKRYVAINLHIAYRKGSETIVNVAQAWMEDLFLPSKLASILITIVYSKF